MRRAGMAFVGTLILLGCQSVVDKGIVMETDANLGAAMGHETEDEGALYGVEAVNSMGHYLDKQAKELAQIAETKRTEKGIITKLKGDVLFDSGKAKLKLNAALKIDQIAQILVKYPEDKIKVVGHMDSKGSDEFNANLSRKRAEAVFNRLLKNGISPQTLQVKGMGKMQPIASNSTSQGRSLNRRVELEISVDEGVFK